MPFVCRRCGLHLCPTHHLPENHMCNYRYRYYHTYEERKRYKRKKAFNTIKDWGITTFIIIIVIVIVLGGSMFIFSLDNSGIFPQTTPLLPLTYPPTTLGITFPPTEIIPPAEIIPTGETQHTYYYKVNGGGGYLFFSTYQNIFDIYNSKDNGYYYYNFEDEVILPMFVDKTQDKYLDLLIKEIKKKTSDSDTQAKIVISFVQHIPYGGSGSEWKYPYETLHSERGVCADKSTLMAYLLNKLGYDVVLFKFPNHMAVGIKTNPAYAFYDTGYAFIETTQPCIITYEPKEYIDGSHLTVPTVIDIPGGSDSIDVSMEYSDAQRYTQLLNMGTVLEPYYYDQWRELTNRYDLLYYT